VIISNSKEIETQKKNVIANETKKRIIKEEIQKNASVKPRKLSKRNILKQLFSKLKSKFTKICFSDKEFRKYISIKSRTKGLLNFI